MRKISHGHYTRRPVEEARASDGSNKGDITQEAACEVRLRRRPPALMQLEIFKKKKKILKKVIRLSAHCEGAPDDPPNFDSDSDQCDMRCGGF